jgi:Fungal specific transcription factor domain
LLFNFDTVDDPLSIAKGSVLLAEQCSSSNNHAGCHWLDIALHHARLIGAHNCDSELDLRVLDALCKKRLWWCILIRDMVLSIGLRIPAKINRIHFNLSSPTMDDLKDYTRVLSSQSFSAQIKYALSQIFGLQCRLAIISSEISTLAYGLTAEIQAEELSMTEFQQIISDLNRCKADLDCWMNDASPVIAFQPAENQSPSVLTTFKHVVFIQH